MKRKNKENQNVTLDGNRGPGRLKNNQSNKQNDSQVYRERDNLV